MPGQNVRVRITCLGKTFLRTISIDTTLRESLKHLMPKNDLDQMLPTGNNVEFSFPVRGEVHLRKKGPIKVVLGNEEMTEGETQVLRKNNVEKLAIGHEPQHVLKLDVVPSHF